ncbi:RNA-binding protein, putative [Plasmodium yoelii]|nr:RNA-binding protein, putative [Plasmodium yoelii]CDU20626.1 RNA-binding protein, putative [Plasmodium yoelii]VTZ81588.1 RNA-binding protein, putative [Plasmodium yoelii]|eukprot:XP_022812907.1 RNA-binding protein, putative [Plasmodium yoelii]
MIFTKQCLFLSFFVLIVSSFLKRKLVLNNYIYSKTNRFKKRKKIVNYQLVKSKDKDVESYIPHIYKDIAPSLKGLADQEYSYKQLLNAYIPETIEREKRDKLNKKSNQKNNKKQSKENRQTNKNNEIDEKEENEENECNKDLSNNIDKMMEIKMKENDIKHFENLSEISNHKKKNKILDIAYDVIEDTLKNTYMNQKLGLDNENNDSKKDYLEIAKKRKDLLYDKLINNYSMLNNSSTFDLFGVFYDNNNYKDDNKLIEELDKIMNLEPFKSNKDNIDEDIDALLKKDKIPTHIRNFILKYKNLRKINMSNKKIDHMKKNENEQVKESGSIKQMDNDGNVDDEKEKDEENRNYEKNIKDENGENIYNDFNRDLNKVLMTFNKNLTNEKLVKRDKYIIDELYEEYKKHIKNMNIKRNKLEPQKDNYDFLTFVHEYGEEFFFQKYGYFDNYLKENVEKIKNKVRSENANIVSIPNIMNSEPNSKQEKSSTITKSNDPVNNIGNEKDNIDEDFLNDSPEKKINKKNDEKNNTQMRNNLDWRKESNKLESYMLSNIVHEYNKRIYDIYKPNDMITNHYGFNNYIDNEEYDKDINVSLNKYSIMNYDSKEELNNDESLYVGKLIFGKIFKIEKNMALVDINYSHYGEIHSDQMPYNITNISDVFKVNDKLIFEIYKMYPNRIELTLKNIQKINDLNKILLYKTQDIPFEVTVLSIIKNGITVSYNDIYTFIHISAISSKYKVIVDENETIDSNLLNKKIKVFCTDINKLSFSNLLYEQNEQLKNINMYDVIDVEIIHISKYGLMVKYNDIVGLIHVSEISRKKMENINNVFKINEKIKGMLINIDYYNKRFSLSTKILETHDKNFIDNREDIYNNIEHIVNNIKKRSNKMEVNDSNIKNQLLSLIDIYKDGNGSEKVKTEEGKDETTNQHKKIQEEIKLYDNEKIDKHPQVTSEKTGSQTEHITDIKNDNNIIDGEEKYNVNSIDNDIKKMQEKYQNNDDDTLSELNQSEEKEELSIDVHNELVPYLLLKQSDSNKEEHEEEKKEIVWNLDDEEFLHSNSPTQNSQYIEYQWSYLKDKKWVSFPYHVNRIINYYFNINDDFFTYKEKTVTYEIYFAKNVRIDLSTGLQNKIRKTLKNSS